MARDEMTEYWGSQWGGLCITRFAQGTGRPWKEFKKGSNDALSSTSHAALSDTEGPWTKGKVIQEVLRK